MKEVGIDTVRESIARIPGWESHEVEEIPGHLSTEVYKISGEKGTCYLRIGGENESMRPEMLAHIKCRKLGVKVPDILYFDELDVRLKRSILITEKTSGSPTTLTNPNIKSILFGAGMNLAILNSIPVNRIGWINRQQGVNQMEGMASDYSGFILDDVYSRARKMEEMGVFDQNMLVKLEEYAKKHFPMLMEYKNQGWLAHGDFGLSHIFSNNGIFSGIIDLGDIRSASPYHDLAHFYNQSPELLPFLIRGYESERKLPDDYRLRIEVEAVAIGINKLWWMINNITNPKPKERCEYLRIKQVLNINND